jgi:hypothetical protein
MIFQDNQDFCQNFVKQIWISRTFCPFWSQFWSTKCKQKRLGTKISRSRKNLKKSTKITKVSISLEREVLDLYVAIDQDILISTESSWSRPRVLDLDREFSIVETKILKVSRFSWLSRSAFFCQDRESWLRHDRDKSRPPGSLLLYLPNLPNTPQICKMMYGLLWWMRVWQVSRKCFAILSSQQK